MALWEIYIDESGDSSYDNLFVLGGYLINSQQSIEMERKWRAYLEEKNIPFFHMVDCAHGNDIFSRFNIDERIEIEKYLISLVVEYVEYGMCWFLNPQRLDNEQAQKQRGSDRSNEIVRKTFQDEYAYALTQLVFHLSKYMRKLDVNADLAIFIEDGHSSKKFAKTALEKNLILDAIVKDGPPITFASKMQVCLLQSADLLVWQAAKYIKDIVNLSKTEPRKDFKALMEANHQFYFISLDRNEVNLMCQQVPGQKMDDLMLKYFKGMFNVGNDADAMLDEVFLQYDRLGKYSRDEALRAILGLD
jgi:Protein of unknown function (DUF3800)